MSWFVSAIPWYGWLILSLVPPLILLLYFLKLRRTPLEVPSTYLWTRTIEDLHVNSIWQRLRNSLLLLLQLLLAGLLLLACFRPGCEGDRLDGDRFIFLLDNSASMAATDLDSGETRLERAKDEIRKMIDGMQADATAMIISFSNESDVVQSYTRNKSLLKRKLAEVRQTSRSSDMTEALTAASGLANPGRSSDRESEVDIQVADARIARMFIFSDGAVAPVPGFSLGNLQTEYRPVGAIETPHNVGITAFTISSDVDTESGVQAFLRLQNSDDQAHAVNVSLLADGETYDAKSGVDVPAENSTVMSFDLTPLLEGFEKPIQLELRIENDDRLPLDNVAYGVLEPARKVNVLVCSPGNNFLKLVMATSRIGKLANVEFQTPSYLTEREFLEKSSLGAFDLIIFDRCAPEQMPVCNTLFIGSVPREEWTASAPQFPTVVIDSAVTHPLLSAVQMANVTIVEGTELTGPTGTISLMDSTYGSIMAIAPRSGFQDLVIGFPLIEEADDETIINSDWPNKLSFPIFVQNCISWLGGAAKFNSSSGTKPGELIVFRSRLPTQGVTVNSPRSRTTRLKPRPDNTYVYAEANETGIYVVTDDNAETDDQLMAVNLFDPRESDLAVRDKLEIGYEEIEAPDQSVAVKARREYWTWVLLLAVVVLMLEWYIYNRRVFL